MMMGQIVADDGLLVVENYQKPGFVSVLGGSLTKPKEMTYQGAEIYKENHIRGKFGLEKTDQMPPKQSSVEKNTCRRCSSPSNLHCSVCRTKYCSRSCQKKDWRRHIFTCRINNRPNDVDYLKIIMIRWSRSTKKELTQAQILLDLYSDNDLCKAFGFNNCLNSGEVANLLCFYGHMTSKLRIKGVQVGVDKGNLGDYMEVFAELTQHNRKDSYCDCPCFTWFLDRRSTGFEIPNWEVSYAYQIFGLREAERALSLEARDDEVDPLSAAEKDILSLYSMLFRDFNNIPGPLSLKWFNFGFCFCTNHGQRMELANLYLQLVKSMSSIGDIARAYESESLSALMKSKGLDLSFFEANGILFHRPGLEERGIYRLIAEVNHTLSGRFCYCFMSKSNCHPKFETHLSRESDGDYGFHGTNTWERWQLLNFYKHVFDRPGFNARKMQEAKRNSDRDKLGQYLDSLVPDFQKKIWNRVLGGAMFPKLNACVRFPHDRPECCCVMHDTIAPEGLNWGTLLHLSHLRRLILEAEEAEFEVSN